MLPVILCAFALMLLYVALMALYRIGWLRQKATGIPAGFIPSASLSIIIPARNEAVNIGPCIHSILAQEYPVALVEIIVVDDHSEDDTAAVASDAGKRIRVISMKQEGSPLRFKKGALAAGISHSMGELIITTDADCIAPAGWLRGIAWLYQNAQPAMIVGPVAYTSQRSMRGIFQSLDFMSMQGITAAAHNLRMGDMANGANLAFTREAYDAVGGYSGIDNLASGDDYLLLHKMRKRFPEGIAYLKSGDGIVRTAPQPTWRAFLQQRIRWASKSGKYPDRQLTAILALVYVFNCAIGTLLIASIWNPGLWQISAPMIVVKWAAEILFLLPVARFYGKKKELWWLLPLQPLHIAYIIVAGFLGMMGSYEWKGRKINY